MSTDAFFLNELDGRWITDKRFMLLADLHYLGVVLAQEDRDTRLLGGMLTIPKGFVTDFASVPRVPIVYEMFGDRAHHESVVHDYLYQTHIATKSVADKTFLEAMKARGKSKFIRTGMYWGVVLGGGSSYKTGPARFQLLNQTTVTV